MKKIVLVILIAIKLAYPNIIDMSEVVDYQATETGLLLEFSDGTGYYWEK